MNIAQEEAVEFNINELLKTLYLAISERASHNRIEILYEMDASVPKKLRGDAKRLLSLLKKMLHFVVENSERKEMFLSVSAPAEFVYEEFVSFSVTGVELLNDSSWVILNAILREDVEALGGQIVKEGESGFRVEIPLQVHELGFRRHYRLASKALLDKKVLILSRSEKQAQMLKKFFTYFPYKTDIVSNTEKLVWDDHDILVVDESALNTALESQLRQMQKKGVKNILVGESENADSALFPAVLEKPVTQEAVLESIHTVYADLLQKHSKKMEDPPKERRETVRKELQILGKDTEKEMLIGFLETYRDVEKRFETYIKTNKIAKLGALCSEMEESADRIGAESLYLILQMIRSAVEGKEFELLESYPAKLEREMEILRKKIKNTIQENKE